VIISSLLHVYRRHLRGIHGVIERRAARECAPTASDSIVFQPADIFGWDRLRFQVSKLDLSYSCQEGSKAGWQNSAG